MQQLVGAVLVCLPLFIGSFQAPVYDKPKVSIGSILHRTLTLSSALTIELQCRWNGRVCFLECLLFSVDLIVVSSLPTYSTNKR